MAGTTIELDEKLVEVLPRLGRPIEDAARELMVMELYRRTEISRGKAAELLGMRLADFLDVAGGLGIPYIFDMTEEEWAAERRVIEEMAREYRSSVTPAR